MTSPPSRYPKSQRPLLSLKDYDISPENGFLPSEPPLRRLENPYFEPWELILDNLSQHISDCSIRDKIHEVLPEAIAVPWVAVAEYLELNPVLSCASVVLWNWQSLVDFENDNDAMFLDNLSTLHTFTGTIDESWFFLITVAIEAEGGNAIRAILRGMKAAENDDIKAMVDELSMIADIIERINRIFERMYEKCDPNAFYWHIRSYFAGGENMEKAGLPYGILYKGVDDEGIEDEEEGSDEYKARFRRYAGGSAGQSSIIQVLDIGLGVTHYPTKSDVAEDRAGTKSSTQPSNQQKRIIPPTPPSEATSHQPPSVLLSPQTPANSYLMRMREYMPGPHRRFLEDLGASCKIREYVSKVLENNLNINMDGSYIYGETSTNSRYSQEDCRDLHMVYNGCVDLLKEFRNHHIQMVTRYIIIPARRGPPANAKTHSLATATATNAPRVKHPQLSINKNITSTVSGMLGTPPPTPPSYGFSREPSLSPRLGSGSYGTATSNSDVLKSPISPSLKPAKYAKLARKVEDDDIVRGTGGTDAISFLKQSRDETASTRI
ncbi:tryptophan 2,3- dioxygenase [Mycoemilia scoparia]|uniref:Tryptophan 2,3- dioxygenase n=1 Tax=Mycoemilia scoparia TaxID=417184 RepID=A0A9W8DRQ8_9FUNG|nr:tryptophan 2,3- dioxygenase [Mycoemilia scoparia]